MLICVRFFFCFVIEMMIQFTIISSCGGDVPTAVV